MKLIARREWERGSFTRQKKQVIAKLLFLRGWQGSMRQMTSPVLTRQLLTD